MPLFLIERNFAEEVAEASPDVLAQIRAVNDDCSISWLYSFLSADKKKMYCLYEALTPDAIRAAAERLGIPADVIVEVSETGPVPIG